ncbi:MAG: hypothetical protein Q9203_004296 [Teloschistes exilis]
MGLRARVVREQSHCRQADVLSLEEGLEMLEILIRAQMYYDARETLSIKLDQEIEALREGFGLDFQGNTLGDHVSLVEVEKKVTEVSDRIDRVRGEGCKQLECFSYIIEAAQHASDREAENSTT